MPLFYTLLIALLYSLALPSWGATSHPGVSAFVVDFNHSNIEPDRVSTEENAHYFSLPDDVLNHALQDRDQLISTEFHVNKKIRPLVEFWFRIYTQYSSYQILFFHENDPSKIYAIQDDRDLFKKGLSPVAHELNSQQKTRSIRKEIRTAFLEIAKNPRKNFAKGTIGYNIKYAWRKSKHVNWHSLSKNVKSQRGQRDFVMRGINSYRPFMLSLENVFKKYNLPSELTRIPLLESSFQINAYSKAAAVGVWQFLKTSGKEYLVIDDKKNIDERLSPVKAAHAAAKMFKRNMRLLEDYSLAIIAYNHGPRNLLKIKQKYGTHNITKLLDPNNKNSPLGESLKLFEEGVSLARKGHDRLNDVERRIEILTKINSDGVETKPYEPR